MSGGSGPRRQQQQQQQDEPRISDEEAIKALLSSAEARIQERTGAVTSSRNSIKSNSRWGGLNNIDQQQRTERNHNQYDREKKKRPYPSESNATKNDSYYGPARNNDADDDDNEQKRSRQRRQEADDPSSGRPHRVIEEGKDGITKDNDKKEEPSSEEPSQQQPQYKPNFGLSGALAKDMQSGNVYKGVLLKFREPPEARAPNTQWRLYVFKRGQKDVIEMLHISKQSAYLWGRNTDIADIHLLHPSISSQHAVLQYRAVALLPGQIPTCQPYIMDLESTNGTFINGVRIDPAKYYQLKKGDVLTFGASTREYVLLTENTTSTK